MIELAVRTFPSIPALANIACAPVRELGFQATVLREI